MGFAAGMGRDVDNHRGGCWRRSSVIAVNKWSCFECCGNPLIKVAKIIEKVVRKVWEAVSR